MSRKILKEGEPHPMAQSALLWIMSNYTTSELYLELGALSSCAIEGNRIGEICAETLSRLLRKEPVSDRYLLGLAWWLRSTKKT